LTSGKNGTTVHVSFFAQILFAGKHFPEKLSTFSHHSQSCDPFDAPFDTQLAFKGTKAHFSRHNTKNCQ